MVELAATAAEDVLAVVVNAVSLDDAVVQVWNAEEVLACIIELRSESGTALAQVVGVEVPTRSRQQVHAEQVVDVPGQRHLGAEDVVVTEADVAQRAQGIV